MYKIIEKYELGPQIYFARIAAPRIAAKAQAGQFVMVRVSAHGERIPLTIADYNRQDGSITLVFQTLGKTTTDLAALAAGDHIADILGPQGNPTDVHQIGDTVVIGGGIGIAPSFTIARALREAGNRVTTIVGFRSQDYVFWEDRMREVSDELIVCTNDGSYGEKGFVTDALNRLIQQNIAIDKVFAIGPAVMMQAIAQATLPHHIPTVVSLNALMVCGMGMCGACRITYDQATKFSCMDGPDMDAHHVDFPELLQRLTTYKNEECSCR